METSIIMWTLWKNTEIANSDFTLFLYPIWDAFWHSFWDLLAWFSIFVRPWFSVAFLDVFFMGLGTKIVPNGSPNGPRISKKSKLVLSSSVWQNSTTIWLSFWFTLVVVWDVLGISWQPFGSLLDMFGVFRASFGHHLRTDWHVAKFVPTHKIAPLVIRATSGKSMYVCMYVCMYASSVL